MWSLSSHTITAANKTEHSDIPKNSDRIVRFLKVSSIERWNPNLTRIFDDPRFRIPDKLVFGLDTNKLAVQPLGWRLQTAVLHKCYSSPCWASGLRPALHTPDCQCLKILGSQQGQVRIKASSKQQGISHQGSRHCGGVRRLLAQISQLATHGHKY